MKLKTLIACRPGNQLASMFFKVADELKCSDSELAKLAILEGLEAAKKKMIQKKREEAKQILDRYKDSGDTLVVSHRHSHRFALA